MKQQQTLPTDSPTDSSTGGGGPPTWHSLDAEAIITRLNTDSRLGLSTRDAERRLQQHGT